MQTRCFQWLTNLIIPPEVDQRSLRRLFAVCFLVCRGISPVLSTIFQAFVSDYAVTGGEAGRGNLLKALSEAGFLIGLERNR